MEKRKTHYMTFTHYNDYALPRNINFNISWYFV